MCAEWQLRPPHLAATPTASANSQGLLAGVCFVVPPALAIASSKAAAAPEPGKTDHPSFHAEVSQPAVGEHG
jgi:hypothetical protein